MAGVQDRVALVTGGAQGIGEAIATRLAAGGAKVAVLDLNADAASATAARIGSGAIGIGADVSKADQVQAAVEQVAAEFGGLHILVNNAGVLRDNMLFKMSEDDWDTVMNVHLKGAFLCTRAAQAHMVQANYGRIVTMSSTSALATGARPTTPPPRPACRASPRPSPSSSASSASPPTRSRRASSRRP